MKPSAARSASLHPPPRPRVRILHVLEATLGGTLRYLENIGDCLSADDFSLGFAYGSSRADSRLNPFLNRIRASGWSTFPLPLEREVSPRAELRSFLSLRRALQAFRPDILHCHSSKAGALGRLAASTIPRRPRVVYSPHAIAASLGKRYLYAETLLRPLTDTYLAVSPSEAAEIAGFGLAPLSKIPIVYPLIDPMYFHPVREAASPISPAPIVLGIGRLSAQKDPLSFIRIVRALQQQRPEVVGVWMGDGSLRDQFLAAAAISGPSSTLQLVPWQHDVRPQIGAAHVLLSTSRYESFGYMVAEALAMAIPAVATHVTGTRDILTGEFSSNLYAPGDLPAAVNLLTRVLDAPDDARDWGLRARRMVCDRFSRESMRRSLEAAYRDVLAEEPSAPRPEVTL